MKVAVALLKNPIHFLSLGFGSGLAPKAPGTAGSAVALLLFLLLPELHWAIYLLLLLLAAGLGVWICGVTAEALGVEDPAAIVWDEFVGIWITLFAAPEGWLWVIAGFAAFRVLDILKPWPVKWADQQVKGGLGIMLDDVIAGIMAALCLWAAAALLGL